jgi:GMP synthase-like glutamine amidotransferase
VDYEALVVLGGGANPDGSGDPAPLDLERSLIADAHARGIPVLGICLGAQLATEALGGRTYATRHTEHGWHQIELTPEASEDPLLAGLERSHAVMQWHAWAFEPPPGAVELARNDACTQAFRIGATTWGFQFHPEVTAAGLEEQIHLRQSTIRDLGLSPARMLADTRQYLPRQLRLAATLASRFGSAVAKR